MSKEFINILTPVGMISFPKLNEPDHESVKRGFDKNAKYKLDLIFPKSTFKTECKELVDAVLHVAKNHFGKEKALTEFKNPFKDGDKNTNKEGVVYNGYQDSIYITVKTEKKPIVVDASRNKLNDEQIAGIKGGDFARAVVSVFSYSQQGGGVSLGLNGLQFSHPGKSLGGDGVAASVAMFGELDAPPLEDVSSPDDSESTEDSMFNF